MPRRSRLAAFVAACAVSSRALALTPASLSVVPPTGALPATTLLLETEGESVLTLDAAGTSSKKRPRPMDMWREMDRSKLVPKRIGLMVEPTPFTHVSGYSNRFNEMLKHLRSTGDVVEVVVPDNSKEAPATAHGFKINTIPGFKFAMYPLITLALDTRMRALYAMKTFKPDLLHVTTPSFLVFPGILVARLLGIPLVLSYHTHLPVYARNYGKASSFWSVFGPNFCEEFSWKVIRIVHSMADLVLVTSPQLKDEFEEHGVERVAVWRKGIDTVRFSPRFKSQPMRSQLGGGPLPLPGGQPATPLLLYVGRIAVEKRLQDLLPVLRAHPTARLAFVGTGPAAVDLEATFAAAGLGNRVAFVGQLSGDALSAAFASADCFVMPSDSETLGFVVLEAMASGVPVVGARAGGIPSLILDGETGFLAEPADPTDLAAKVGLVLASPQRREALGAAARQEAERWDWEAATAHLRNKQYVDAVVNFKMRPHALARCSGWVKDRGLTNLGKFTSSFVGAFPAIMV